VLAIARCDVCVERSRDAYRGRVTSCGRHVACFKRRVMSFERHAAVSGSRRNAFGRSIDLFLATASALGPDAPHELTRDDAEHPCDTPSDARLNFHTARP